MNQKPQKNERFQDAIPLSPAGRILDSMLARYGAETERAKLMRGHTFGSAVAQARKSKRITIEDLVKHQGLAQYDALNWNEFEQDRRDPNLISVQGLQALEELLEITVDELKKYASHHEEAFAEQGRLWSLLTMEEHAFRARRIRD